MIPALARPFLAVSLLLPAVIGAYARLIEPHWLDLQRVDVPIDNLPFELDRFTIAQMSDLHANRQRESFNLIRRAIDLCNRERPDCVVLTGDFVVKRRALPAFLGLIEQITTRPAFAVLGNHDYRFGPRHRRSLVEGLIQRGIQALDNSAAPIERGPATAWIVGVGDAYTSHDDITLALHDVPPEAHPRILLSHYPDLLCSIAPGTFDLALSGHTHGAQINLPFISGRALAHSDTTFRAGLYNVGGTPLYVNRGLGTSGLPLRLFARPEVTIFRLVRR